MLRGGGGGYSRVRDVYSLLYKLVEGNSDSEEASEVQNGRGVTRLNKPRREGMDPKRVSGEYEGLGASRLNKPREGG